MSESMTSLEAALDEALCGFSSARLSQLSGGQRVDPSRPAPGLPLGDDRWSFQVRVVFDGIDLKLRCHYSESAARRLAELSGGCEEGDGSSTWHSFIGEYCNLIGGAVENCISSSLRKQGLAVTGALELPVKSQASRPRRGASTPSSAWFLELPSGDELVFLAWIDVSDRHLEEQGVTLESLAMDIERDFEEHEGMTEGAELEQLMEESMAGL